MSATQPLPVPPVSAWSMIRAMVGVGLLCGFLIVSVFQVTRPVIERNKAEALRRAVLRVLPAATSSATFRPSESGGFERVEDDAAGAVYAAYDAERTLVGVAVPAQEMGYQDVIRLLYGYSFAADAIVGIQVLESRETPGLGDRIETDPQFLANFERLDVSLTEDLSTLVHAIERVKSGEKRHPWQIDGITGATISSVAVTRALARSAARWVPPIRGHLDDFEWVE